MASFPCPYCGRAVAGESEDARVERCPSCDGGMVLGYRYRLVAARGKLSGGELYEAVDEIFGGSVAALFVSDPDDPDAVARFIEGNRMFGELGGGRGLVKLRELGTEPRAHVVFDQFAHGTLDQLVRKRGPLDQGMLLELVSDLLVGLGKAHRAMPSLIHGHIHPGKIGFVSLDGAVLFGFEHARKLFEQDSRLADAFVANSEDHGPDRASDLRQLGLSLFYAATGEWPGQQPIRGQIAAVQQRLSGPLATLFTRMLSAGDGGYHSAIDALIDFEHLIEGTSKWQARARTTSTEQQAELDAAAWVPSGELAQRAADQADADQAEYDTEYDDDGSAGEPDDEPDGEPDDDEIADFSDRIEDILESESSDPGYRVVERVGSTAAGEFGSASKPWTPPATTPSSNPAGGVFRVLGVIMAGMFVFSMCVAGIVDELDEPPPPPPIVFEAPPVPIDPMPEFEPVPVPEIVPPASQLSGIHHYSGTVTGPSDHAGIKLGTVCDVWIEPAPGDPNCRFYVDCGKPRRRIYGGGDVGYSDCTVEDGHPTFASDEEQDPPDGAFLAVLNGPDPMVLVQDRWLQPPTRVLISIVDGGSEDGPIPDVKLAKRKTREQIEAAMERNDLPEF